MKQKKDLKRNQKMLKIAAAAIWMMAAGVCYSCSSSQNSGALLLAESEELKQTLEAEETKELAGHELPLETVTVEEQKSYCYVHICGEVESPGVYRMEEGNRIFQVVECAGGYTSQAARSYLNMAQPVMDGMKLVVPSVEELEQDNLYGEASPADKNTGEPAASVKVNINTATKEQLMVLKGIGKSRAEDIIRYREEHGEFEKTEDIMKVSGIKEAAFLKIKDDITV